MKFEAEISSFKEQLSEANERLTAAQGNLSTREQDLIASHETTVARITEEHKAAIGELGLSLHYVTAVFIRVDYILVVWCYHDLRIGV